MAATVISLTVGYIRVKFGAEIAVSNRHSNVIYVIFRDVRRQQGGGEHSVRNSASTRIQEVMLQE